MSNLYPPNAETLQHILEQLRAPDGCPWDRQQTRESLSRCLVEETAELLDAIDAGDVENICEELGDVQMNLIFQAVVAAERREFTYQDVLGGIIEKMLRRHPHVFGDVKVQSADDVVAVWEKVKATEKGHDGEPHCVLDGVPRSLSALATAGKLQKKAAKYGFDWNSSTEIVAKIAEELTELSDAMREGDEEHIDEELGDVLFAAVNLARFRNRDPEEILRNANRKFKRRFQAIEHMVREKGLSLEAVGTEELERLWQLVKKQESTENA